MMISFNLFELGQSHKPTKEQIMSGHNTTHAGLQNHSVGDFYPYSIRHRGEYHVQLFDCRTGSVVCEIEYGDHIYRSHNEANKELQSLARELLQFEALS